MDISQISTAPGIDSLVAQYMAIERRPIYKLEADKTDTDTKLAMFSDLKDKLKALRETADDLKLTGSFSKFGAKATTSADDTVVTASGNGNAVNGSHLIKITQLAKADTVVTNRVTSAGTAIRTTEGTGTKTIKITINGVETNVNVEIADGEDDETILTNIAAAINNSDATANASVVNDSQSTNKLILRSDTTGSTYGISLADVTGTLLNTIGLSDSVQATATTGGYMYADSELNSIFELDGISITHDSNTVDDVLTGITLNLKGTQEAADDAVQITIEPDKDSIKANLNEYFEKHNEIINYLAEKIAVDPDAGVRGQLSGDFTFINLKLNLRTLVSDAVSSVQSGNPTRIADVGIEPDDDGNLSIADEDDLDDALDASVAKVEDLFNSDNGIANQIYDLITPFTSTGGIIDDSRTSLNTKIGNIDDRIESLEERMMWKEQNYRNQFLKLQQAFDALGIQQGIVSMVSNSINSGWR